MYQRKNSILNDLNSQRLLRVQINIYLSVFCLCIRNSIDLQQKTKTIRRMLQLLLQLYLLPEIHLLHVHPFR